MKSETKTLAQKVAATKADERVERTDAGMIARAIELQDAIKEIQGELETIKTYFKQKATEALGEKSQVKYATPLGVAIYKVSNSYSIRPEKMPELKVLFGKNIKAFVVEKTGYSPTPQCRKLALDADYENASTLRESIDVKTSHSVSFERIIEN